MLAENVFDSEGNGQLRPFRVERDLSPLSDLIALAFKDELERTANPLVAEMRRLAKLGPVLWLVGGSQGLLPPLMDGYVWIVDGRLVGNVTLMRESGARGLWSVSNVAVLPAYRRQGIARRLMEAAIRRALDRGAHRLVLEVSAENEAARRLYHSLGFAEYDAIRELLLPRFRWPEQLEPTELPLRPWRSADAPGLYELLRTATPPEAQDIKPIALSRYGTGFDNHFSAWLGRLLGRSVRSAWVLDDTASITAVLRITERYRRDAHEIDIVVHPQHRGAVEDALLNKALSELSRFPLGVRAAVSEAHPQAVQAFEEAGFETVRVLAQMTLDLRALQQGVVL